MLSLFGWVSGLMAESLPALQDEAKWDGWLVDSSLKNCEDMKDLFETHDCCGDAGFSDEYLIFKRQNNVCPLGWRTLEVGGESVRCVKVARGEAVWTHAQAVAACEAEGGGSHLIRPTSAAKDAVVKALIRTLITSTWRFWWIDARQDALATSGDAGWSWGGGAAVDTALVSVDSSSNAWATYQPTTFDGGPHDGPEDCVLYGSFNPSNPAIHKQDTSSGWWYDFGCSPAAAVVCMTPYINIPNFPSMSGCWGGAGYAATTIERPNDLCLMLLPDEVYNLHEARGACAEHNGLLVYTRNASAQVNLNAWVQAQGTNHAKVWINMQQDDAATDPKSGWTLPTGEVLPKAALLWNSPSDPEPVEADHDQAVLLVGSGKLQDITSMDGGAGAICERSPLGT